MKIHLSLKSAPCNKQLEEIARKVAKEEIEASRALDGSKIELQAIISQAIVQGISNYEEEKQKQIKESKLSTFTIISMVIFSIVTGAFLILGIAALVFISGNFWEKLELSFPLLISSACFLLVVFSLYIIGKNKDHGLAVSIVSFLVALFSMVYTILAKGG